MSELGREELERLAQLWREASDAVWEARRSLAAALDDAARTEAELRLVRAELQVENLRQAVLLFGLAEPE